VRDCRRAEQTADYSFSHFQRLLRRLRLHLVSFPAFVFVINNTNTNNNNNEYIYTVQNKQSSDAVLRYYILLSLYDE